MNRFKLIDPSGRTENKTFKTIKEVVKELLSENRDASLQKYFIQCLIDDIEIDSDELLMAWKDGERPEDLQMF